MTISGIKEVMRVLMAMISTPSSSANSILMQNAYSVEVKVRTQGE